VFDLFLDLLLELAIIGAIDRGSHVLELLLSLLQGCNSDLVVDSESWVLLEVLVGAEETLLFAELLPLSQLNLLLLLLELALLLLVL
jgi:hypothetical protein